MADQVPPRGIVECFLPREQPTFKLLRRAGACCLWRSQTAEHQVLGYNRPVRVRYHVTVGKEAEVVLVARFETALLNFNLVVQECDASSKL